MANIFIGGICNFKPKFILIPIGIYNFIYLSLCVVISKDNKNIFVLCYSFNIWVYRVWIYFILGIFTCFYFTPITNGF